MSEKIVLGLTGFSGTGKTTLAEYLSREHGFTLFENSSRLRHAAAEAGQTLSSRNDYEQFFRQQQVVRGLSWLSDEMLAIDADRLLQVGLRSPHDLRNIQRVGGRIIGLVCPPSVCITRIDTTDPKNPSTIEEYIQHQAIEESLLEVGSHTAWAVMNANYGLNTASPIEHTYAELNSIVAEFAKI